MFCYVCQKQITKLRDISFLLISEIVRLSGRYISASSQNARVFFLFFLERGNDIIKNLLPCLIDYGEIRTLQKYQLRIDRLC